jgi:hypothetical protein
MGGMFTILKVREGIARYDDPGWYQNPAGTVASVASAEELRANEIHAPASTERGAVYTCPMHPEVRMNRPGKCPRCGMKLVQKG